MPHYAPKLTIADIARPFWVISLEKCTGRAKPLRSRRAWKNVGKTSANLRGRCRWSVGAG